MRSTAYRKQGAPDRRSPTHQKTYPFYMRSTAYKKQGAPDRRSLTQQKTYTFYTRITAYKKQGAPDRRSLTQQKAYIFYTCSTAYKKARDPRSAVPYSAKKTYAFYMRSITYKKQGAPDRRSLIRKKREREKSMLFTRVAPCTKSTGLPIGAPHILYYFQNALRRVQKARGSVGMRSRFIILLIMFPEVFAAQLVSSSLCIIHTISHQIPIDGAIYFSYTTVINIRGVRGIYLYLSKSSSSSMQKKKITEH
jgi:hypothetical protein